MSSSYYSYYSQSGCDEGAGCNASSAPRVDGFEQGIDWAVVGPSTAAYALIFLLGVVGNALVIFAVHRCRRLHTATSLLLANLAAADLLLVGLLVPVKVAVELLNHWPLGEAPCRLLAYVNIACPTCSMLTMTAIALERCYAVLFPLEAKSAITMGRTRLAIVAIWTVSLVLSIPTLFSKTTKVLRGGGDRWVICNDAWRTEGIALAYTIYVTLVLFGLPLLVLTACYTLVIVRLCASKRMAKRLWAPPAAAAVPMGRPPRTEEAERCIKTASAATDDAEDIEKGEGAPCSPHGRETGRANSGKATQRRRRQRRTEAGKLQRIVAMLVVVVVVFVLCWGPFFTYSLLLRAGVVSANYTDAVWRASLALHLLAYGNSCVNPFIYAFMSESFREGFASACRGGGGCCRTGRGRGMGRGNQSRSHGRQSSSWPGANATRNFSLTPTSGTSCSTQATCRV